MTGNRMTADADAGRLEWNLTSGMAGYHKLLRLGAATDDQHRQAAQLAATCDESIGLARDVANARAWSKLPKEARQGVPLMQPTRDPFEHEPPTWPAWLTYMHGAFPREKALKGWRAWSITDTDDGPRLVSPFIAKMREDADLDAPRDPWVPGVNTNDPGSCAARVDAHPVTDCGCGIRVMKSLALLRAYLNTVGGPGVGAYALTDFWGRMAPPEPGNDWQWTARAEHAEISSPLYVVNQRMDAADALAGHYGVQVLSFDPIWKGRA